tara:strand:+ start:639 stop:824 length:186 start_codon:yes stop_codon:yes gene_type:complete
MPKNLTVTGSNPIAENERFEALNIINQLSDVELERLSQLAKSPKAKAYLNNKWGMLKNFIL